MGPEVHMTAFQSKKKRSEQKSKEIGAVKVKEIASSKEDVD